MLNWKVIWTIQTGKRNYFLRQRAQKKKKEDYPLRFYQIIYVTYLYQIFQHQSGASFGIRD